HLCSGGPHTPGQAREVYVMFRRQQLLWSFLRDPVAAAGNDALHIVGESFMVLTVPALSLLKPGRRGREMSDLLGVDERQPYAGEDRGGVVQGSDRPVGVRLVRP